MDPELMEFLHQGRRTGSLRVITPAGERAIVLKDGMVRGAGSDDPRINRAMRTWDSDNSVGVAFNDPVSSTNSQPRSSWLPSPQRVL